MADNLSIAANGDTYHRLKAIFPLAASYDGEPPMFRSWAKTPTELHLFRNSSSGTAFPNALSAEIAAMMAWDYLKSLTRADYPPEPNIDGDCKMGWTLTSLSDKVVITPCWMIYHK